MSTRQDPTSEELRTFNVLDEEESRYLLRSETVGRLAFTEHAGPTVLPVNFAIVDDAVVFRTEATLAERVLDRPVSFQADRIDPVRRIGWSVLVRGLAELLDDDAIHDGSVEPWAPGDRFVYVRILPSEITGRRLGLASRLSNTPGQR
jgi:nitroimidazol reductase NimA-like FMN-containing flavoprotein (pyridoxamine 5'-phosphate oxidase superfamily)